MKYPKFNKFLERKDPELVRTPKIIKTGDKLVGADDLCGEPNKPPKEAMQKKNVEKVADKQPQVKEGLWNKFLEKKEPGSVVEKPATEIIADYPFKQVVAPPEAKTKGKNWDAKAPKTSKPAPYKQGTDTKPKNNEEGLGNLGSIPKEEIKTKAGDSPYIPGGKTVGDYTSKTEAFLNKTKGMPINEFAQYMIKEERSVEGIHQAEVPQAIKYIASVATNENILRDLVVALKQKGLINNLLEMVMEYPEAYQSLTNLLGEEQKGSARCNALVRAMNEIVGPPIGIDDMGDDEEGMSHRIGADGAPEDFEDEEDDEDYPEDEFGDEEDDEEDEFGDEDEMGDEDELGDEMGGLGDEEPEMGMERPIKKMMGMMGMHRGRFAMDHLIHALNQYMKRD